MYFGPESRAPVRVLLVEDQERARRRLLTLLSACPDLEVVAEAQDGSEAVCLADSYRPEVVLMDLPVPGMGGTQAVRLIKHNWPETAVLALTNVGEFETDAPDAGADAFLSKSDSTRNVIEAIRNLAARSRS